MNPFSIVIVFIITLFVSACGGGGGGAAAPAESTSATPPAANGADDLDAVAPDYTPDGSLLTNAASSSSDLYVETTFNFDSHSLIDITIGATDSQNNPLRNTPLKLYQVPAHLTEWSDEALSSARLLGTGTTNAEGLFRRSIEISDKDSQILVVLETIGIENKALLPINGSTIEYYFE